MQQEQNQADHQDDVDQACGYVKREKPKQPENDEDCGDYPKHVFISWLPGAGTSAMLRLRTALMLAAARKQTARDRE
jgi:hypothetical protein